MLSPLLTLYLNQFLIFVLVLTRIGALIMTLPVLGGSTIPVQIRAFLAVAVAFLIAPLHWGHQLPEIENMGALGLLMAREMILGLALGTSVMILLSGMQLAGQVISQMSGLSLADVANPTFDTTVPILSQLLESVAIALFFLLGGHRLVLAALLDSFTWLPPGAATLPDELPMALVEVTAHSFHVGIRASAPVMVALFLAVLVVALISRTLPQLNAVAIGLNFNAIIVPLMIAITIGSAAITFQEELGGVLQRMRDVITDTSPAIQQTH
ncbi:flagellar biosynthesis protein FliR [Anatilimnocola aggregata]|uniref:Flagellar biosynthesis protein FliR n=2 Tax=Anatilimnocola aggregata TaxID=2528021 RepID=A0A517YFZ9_9BACT|nr:flagellar biosynthesis protein FliR [Anatilimnocola aggregata]